MKKTTIFLILILAVVIIIPIAYAVFPQYQTSIGDFFGGLQQSAMVLFTGFSSQFMQLPYWVAIFGGICFLSAIVIDRWAWGIVLGWRKKLVGDARRDSGLITQTPYQGPPAYSTPNPQPPQPAPAATPQPQLEEAE